MINKKGKEIIKPEYDEELVFYDGISSISKNGKYGFIDQNGKIIAKCKYDYAGAFVDGFACVMKDWKVSYINTKGKTFAYSHIGPFSDGYACADKNGKTGYINKSGQFVISPKYDYASDFSDGAAIAKNGDQYYILTVK